MDIELGKVLLKKLYRGKHRPSLDSMYSNLGTKHFYPLKFNNLTQDLGQFIKDNCAHGLVWGLDKYGEKVEIGVVLPYKKEESFIECVMLFSDLSNKTRGFLELRPDVSVEMIYKLELLGRKILE